MQRIPVKDRWTVLEHLTRHAADANDHNLPLMYWYAAEPLAEADPERALAFGLSCGKTVPLVRDFMLRRIGSLKANSGLPAIVRALGKIERYRRTTHDPKSRSQRASGSTACETAD